jgi:hypothetical protein
MARQRYVIRLHKLIRKELDILARKKGHLTPAFISMAIEEICSRINPREYEIHPDSEVFQLKRGNCGKGNEKNNADKQMSVYLSDFSYSLIADLAARLQQEIDKNISPAYVIRDMLFHWLEKNSHSDSRQ